MTQELHHLAAPDRLYRLGRAPDPWAWPDWSHSLPDGTFGNRYDDADGRYRVLYASSQRLGTFVETLARFRPDPAVVAGLSAIDGDEGTFPAGVIEPGWLRRRRMGVARVTGRFVDISHSRSLSHLHHQLPLLVVEHGVRELDAAAVRLSVPRSFTQRLSRYIYDQTDANGRRRLAGIRYPSRLGDDFENWAVFEPAELIDTAEGNHGIVQPDDPDLLAAMRLHQLRWIPTQATDRPSQGP